MRYFFVSSLSFFFFLLLLLLVETTRGGIIDRRDSSRRQRIWVKFDPEHEGRLPAIMKEKLSQLVPLVVNSQQTENRRKGRRRRRQFLKEWFQLTLLPNVSIQPFLATLQSLPGVLAAELAPVAVEPPSPDYSIQQGYLDDTYVTNVWRRYGNTGGGVTVFDVEYNWNLNHEDLMNISSNLLLLQDGDEIDPIFNGNHGTAVLGTLVGNGYNDFGIMGMVYDASVRLVPSNTKNLGYDPINAIVLATQYAKPGDVILIEQQFPVCGYENKFGPLEGLYSVFDAIKEATAMGVTVVEAAGNGGVNLDSEACGSYFDPSFQDSGAIIVGASSANTRTKIGFSTYGSRVNVHGWGSRVTTTGYGVYFDRDDPADTTKWYTPSFGGTSSAAAMVAGAAALLQSVSIQERGEPLSPQDVRRLLIETGSRQQQQQKDGRIGPLPNVKAAVDAVLCQPLCNVPDDISGNALSVQVDVQATAKCVGGSSLFIQKTHCNVHDRGFGFSSMLSPFLCSVVVSDGGDRISVSRSWGKGVDVTWQVVAVDQVSGTTKRTTCQLTIPSMF